jgi:hypothetical protein
MHELSTLRFDHLKTELHDFSAEKANRPSLYGVGDEEDFSFINDLVCGFSYNVCPGSIQ